MPIVGVYYRYVDVLQVTYVIDMSDVISICMVCGCVTGMWVYYS